MEWVISTAYDDDDDNWMQTGKLNLVDLISVVSSDMARNNLHLICLPTIN